MSQVDAFLTRYLGALSFSYLLHKPDSGYCRAPCYGYSSCLFESLRIAAFRSEMTKIIRSKSAGWPDHGRPVANLKRVSLLTRGKPARSLSNINQTPHNR